MVAIPASMLTFGFEIEAQRLVLKRRERRLRRRIRAERLENHWIESCSDSEDGDAHFLAREQQRASALPRRPPRDASDLSSSEGEYETLVLGETQEATLERVQAANSRPSRRSTTRCCGPWRPRRRPCSSHGRRALRERGPMELRRVVYYLAFGEEKKQSL